MIPTVSLKNDIEPLLIELVDELDKKVTAFAYKIYALLDRDDTGEHLPPTIWQCEPSWRDKPYSQQSSLTFCQAGCLVCSTYSLARWAGYDETLLVWAWNLNLAEAFVGGELKHPSRVEPVCNNLRWRYDKWLLGQETSYVDWRRRPVDLELLEYALDLSPVVVEVDFKPLTRPVDQHFVLAIHYEPPCPEGSIEDDLLIMDSWTGTYTNALTYFNPAWLDDGTMAPGVTKVQRTLTGARVWEVVR